MGEVFGDTTITSTIIERHVHHSIIMNNKGKTYRIEDLIQEYFYDEKKQIKATFKIYQKPTIFFYQKPKKSLTFTYLTFI